EAATRPAQEDLEPALAFQRERKGEEMQRQEQSQQQPGQAMHQGRDPQRLAAMGFATTDRLAGDDPHAITTAMTARPPSTMSRTANASTSASRPRPFSGVHS